MLSTQFASALFSPFAMLLNPEEVVSAMEHSERLNGLHSRVYRPLDKPLIPKGKFAAADFDRMIDETPDEMDLIEQMM
ncbi:hypothetical protein [Roseateles oligotrophus]|uniref:Uncharacterized protein n=1 Tax=Roseateles oligotrophus TaxID=1769250 RepID=A0ABT2YFY8_9BURK|nr:hypothetical protein [Roseateles oligotrophus]MCV2368963.1 hypothetical protein [Roseateles oligotrophus]